MKRLLSACMFMIVLVACGTASPSSSPSLSATNSPPAAQSPEPTKPAGVHACVTSPTTKIRQGPGPEYSVVDGLVAGTCLTLLERNADSTWFYIRTRDDVTGWVEAALVTITSGSSLSTGANTVSSPGNTPSAKDAPACSELANQTNSDVICKIEQASCVFRPELSGNPSFCYDQSFPQRVFQLVIPGDNWTDYDGHCMIVSGYLEAKFDGQRAWLQIIGTARSQVSDC